MIIRAAQRSDASRIAEIHSRSFYQTFRTEKNDESVRSYLQGLKEDAILAMIDEGIEFYLADDDDKTLAFIQLSDESWHEDRLSIKIERLYVDPDHLKQNCGSALMHFALEKAGQDGCHDIWLLVLRSNTRAVRFYEHLGFVTFDTSPGKFIEDRELDLWMKKDIT
jgi:ribosomal protein S18 acetylase RimI-like enzyme